MEKQQKQSASHYCLPSQTKFHDSIEFMLLFADYMAKRDLGFVITQENPHL